MKRRLISILVALSMMVVVMPVIGHAETEKAIDGSVIMESEIMTNSDTYVDDYYYEQKIIDEEKQSSDHFIVKYKTKNQQERKLLQASAKSAFKELKAEKEKKIEILQKNLSEEAIEHLHIRKEKEISKLFSLKSVLVNEMLDNEFEYEVIELEESINKQQFVSQIEAEMGDAIEYIQPDIEMEMSSVNASEIVSAVNDKVENLSQAHNVSTGNGVTVALIDTGVDITHLALSDKVVTGWDFFNDTELTYSAEQSSDAMHGTHIAGIISQVAPDAKIMPLKVFEGGKAYTSDIIKAIKYAEENGADIINCSWGNSAENPALKEIITELDMFFVAAAGNNRINLDETPVYPASYALDNVINVTSVNQDGGMSYFSNYGESVDIAAWGRDVYSAMPNNEYGNMTGTSMSAGYVTGAAALAAATGTPVAELKDALKSSANKVSTLENIVDDNNLVDFVNIVYDICPQEITYVNAEDDFDKWKEKTPEENWELFNSKKNIQVATGSSHSVVLKNDGTVWLWGDNYYGKIENDVQETNLDLRQIIGLEDICYICANSSRTMALKTDGTVWIVGYTQHANGDDESYKYLPKQVPNLPSIRIPENEFETTVALSSTHAMAVDTDGMVWAWGWKGYGCLGDGEDAENGHYQENIPIKVKNIRNIKSVAVGFASSFAVDYENSLWCWGNGKDGKLGLGESISICKTPKKMSLSQIKMISVSEEHSVALKEDGTVWTWGYNESGQTGDINTDHAISSPKKMIGFSSVKQCCAALETSVVLKEDGRVWSCGEPYLCGGGAVMYPEYLSSAHAQAMYLHDIKSISSTYRHALALDNEGNLWGWGSNVSGQLGKDTQIDIPCPKQITNSEGQNCFFNPKSVSAGEGTSFVLCEDGTVWAWGRNELGQLGDGTTIDRDYPIKVKNIEGNGYLENVSMISAGDNHCIALINDGTVVTWGKIDSNKNSLLPCKVKNEDNTGYLSNIKSITAGINISAALKEDGTVVTWKNSALPKIVPKLDNIVAVAVSNHNLALKNDGTVFAWSYPTENNKYDSPVKVKEKDGGYLNNIIAIDVGHAFSVALDNEGNVWNWGDNSRYQLGSGNKYTDGTSSAERVCYNTTDEYLSNICSISANRFSSVALSQDKSLYGWGNNDCGQILIDCSFLNRISAKNENLSNIKIPETDNEKTISTGYSHSLIIKEDGTVWRIGNNRHALKEDGTLRFTEVPCLLNDFVNVSEPKTITTVTTTPSEITVEYGTSADALDLPTQAEVELDNGNDSTTLRITEWDKSEYKADVPGEYTVYGTLGLTDDITNPQNFRAEVKVIVGEPPRPRITLVDKAQITADQSVPLNTGDLEHSISEPMTVELPEKVSVHLNNGETRELNVTWKTSSYNPHLTGKQTVWGDVELAEGIENPNKLLAELEITVVPTEYEVVSSNPETISIDVLAGTTKEEILEMIEPKVIDVEVVNTETNEIVYIYTGFTFSEEYEENTSYDPNKLGTQTLIGKFYDNFIEVSPAYVEVEVNVVSSEIDSVDEKHIDAYQCVKFEDIENLPDKVTVNLKNGMKTEVEVEWNSDNYQKDIAGDQLITGTLVNLPVGVTQPEEEKTAALIVHVKPVSYEVTAVTPDEDLFMTDRDGNDLPAGLNLSELRKILPVDKVKVQLTSVTEGVNISIEYELDFTLEEENNPNYIPEEIDIYNLSGTLVETENVKNPENLLYEFMISTSPVEIIEVETTKVTVDYYTEFEDINLPEKVYVKLSNGQTTEISVDWGTGEGYNPNPDALDEDNPMSFNLQGEFYDVPEYINLYHHDNQKHVAPLEITLVLPKVYTIKDISPVRIPETGTKKINLGTEISDINALIESHTATVTLENLKGVTSTQEVTFTLREEDNTHYDSMSEEEFELIAYLNLPDGILNPDNKQLVISVRPTKYIIKSVVATRVNGVLAGTAFEDIEMPDTVTVNYSDEDVKQGEVSGVIWDGSKYLPDKIGNQAVKGTFSDPLPVYVTNPNRRTPSAIVNVINPTVRMLSAKQITETPFSSLKKSVKQAIMQDEEIDGFIERKYEVELLHEDGSITTEIISIFDKVEEN